MRSELLLGIFALWSVLLCPSDGTPPKKQSRRTYKRGDTYSPQEDMFIIRGLESLVGTQDTSVWLTLEEAHKNKRNLGCAGFTRERTARGMREHFVNFMIKRNDTCTSAVTVPDSLKTIFGNTRFKYSSEEEDLIKELLFFHTNSNLKTHEVWETIADQHALKRKSGASGFSYERTSRGLRDHFFNIMMNRKKRSRVVIVPDSVKRKFRESKLKYSREEEDFINAELSSYSNIKLNNREMWEKIARKHDLYRYSGAPGFSCERSSRALRSHFYHIMKPRGLVPESVMRKFPRIFSTTQRDSGESSSKAKELGGTLIRNSDETNYSQLEGGVDLDDKTLEVWGPIIEDLVKSQKNTDEFGVDHTMFLETTGAHNSIFSFNAPYEARTFERNPSLEDIVKNYESP